MQKGLYSSLRPPVSQWIEAFNSHDVASVVALYTEDAELFDAGMRYPRRGRREIERWFSTRFSTMPSITYAPGQPVFMEIEQATVTWTVSGHGPRPFGQAWLCWLSRPFRVDGVSVFVLRDGLIRKQRGYYDHLSVLEQLVLPLRWLRLTRL